MDRILKDAKSTIKVSFRDSDGNLADPDNVNTVTASIVDSAGVAVTGSPFTASHVSTGVFSVALTPTVTAALDTYSVTWTATIDAVSQKRYSSYEVVGDFLFGIADLRAFDPSLTAALYPTDTIVAAREAAEERLELLCGTAFVPRGRRVVLDGTGDLEIIVPDVEVTSVTAGSIDAGSGAVALTSGDLSDLTVYPWGVIRRNDNGVWDSGNKNVSLLYVHGYTQAPEPIRRAAMALARANLVGLSLFDRARSQAVEGGILTYTLAGRDGVTGIPEVDAVISAYSRNVPRFA